MWLNKMQGSNLNFSGVLALGNIGCNLEIYVFIAKVNCKSWVNLIPIERYVKVGGSETL